MNLVFPNIMAELNIFSVFPISDTYYLPSGDNIFDFIKGVVLTSAGNSIPMAKRTIEDQPLKNLWIDCESDVNAEVRYLGEIQYKGRVPANGFTFVDLYYDELIITTTAATETQVIGSSNLISGVGGASGGGVVQTETATTPTLYIITMTTANIEYPQALPANTKIFEFRCRDPSFDIRYAFETGKVAGSSDPFRTLSAGQVKTLEGLDLDSKILYVACSTLGNVVELECWS